MGVGRVEWAMRIKGVDAHEPGTVVGFVDEFDCTIGTPGGLMVIWIHVGAEIAVGAVFLFLEDIAEVYALFSEPIGVLIADANALIVRMAVPKLAIPIVHAFLLAIPGRGDVEFA